MNENADDRLAVRCGGCGKTLRISKRHAGREGKCRCGASISVPENVLSPPPLPDRSSADDPSPVEIAESVINPNLLACPDCGGSISRRATACPHCGAPVLAAESGSAADTELFRDLPLPQTPAIYAQQPSPPVRQSKTARKKPKSKAWSLFSLFCVVLFLGFQLFRITGGLDNLTRDRSSPAYTEGYSFGKRAGENGYQTNNYDATGAKERARYIAGKTYGTARLENSGTPEYGDFMAGLEDGYYDGYNSR